LLLTENFVSLLIVFYFFNINHEKNSANPARFHKNIQKY